LGVDGLTVVCGDCCGEKKGVEGLNGSRARGGERSLRVLELSGLAVSE
jgi:hypothetical protein